jgi:hypothetical protein
MFTDLGPSLPLIPPGEIARAWDNDGRTRCNGAGDSAACAKSVWPGYDAAAWSMLIAPAKTPRPILTRLNAEVNAIVNTAEVKQQLVNLGINPIGRGSLDELQAFVKAEEIRWGKVVQEAGLAGSE